MRRRQMLAAQDKAQEKHLAPALQEIVKTEINPLKCLICGKVAKSMAGLAAHMANSKDHRGT